MELFLNSVGMISGAGNNVDGGIKGQAAGGDVLLSIEPDYKAFIPVMQLRRMSKAVRMGVVASKVAMQNVGIESPDAISVGTAYGCLQDTEKFLDKLVEQNEQMLTPTAFIQSTHNTVSGQIALLAKCTGHNLTYVHRGHSFEHAMINAQLYLSSHTGEHMLVGGIDELTDNAIKALRLSGLEGSLGEGAVFFSVTDKPISDTYIKVTAVDVFKTDDIQAALDKTKAFISRYSETDAVVLGGSNTDYYDALTTNDLKNISSTTFKQFSGEYPTASSFALGWLLDAIKNNTLNDIVWNAGAPQQLKNVLLINNFKKYYSCWKLELSV
ncbi:MAG: beta-ketoacyl synthase chain length factor [Chitinophagales bacterium]|nr:beta-ketoacyl synthase chain length factor [Chitinophagaceae bacterium]MCB9065438.1 beta-ketoacyl synthase chain length factor [Chitinophagales bacterium]